MLRHIVLLKWKPETTPKQIEAIETAFRALPAKIETIVGFEGGANNSPEGLAQGFTHCFLLTFKTAADRDAYLPHPAHQQFGEILSPHLQDVLVVDFWVKE